MIDLRLGDCLDILPTLAAGSIGHVVTDPPYGQSNESYDRGVDPAVWRECYRVTGLNAALVSFAGSPTYHRIASDIEAAGWKVRQMWAWVYRNGFMTSAYPREGFDRLAPAFDPIVFATKGKVLLSLAREGRSWSDGRDPKRSGKTFSARMRDHGSRSEAGGHWPRALVAESGVEGFEYFALNPNSPSLRAEKVGHPNQKPLALMRWIVGKLPISGPILDPFAGSGSTLEAARLEGHDAIGIESGPVYHATAQRRLAEVQDSTPLFAGTA